MKKLLLILAFVAAVIAPAPAPVGAVSGFGTPLPGATSCTSVAAKLLGDRTCYDASDFTITIFSGGTTVFASFGVYQAQYGCPTAHYWSNSLWSVDTYQKTTISAADCPTWGAIKTNEGCGPNAANTLWMCNAANHDLLEWFANVGSQEFLVVP